MALTLRLCFLLLTPFLGLVRGSGISDVGQAQAFLDDYNVKAAASLNSRVKASWAYNTDITKENSDKMIAENLRHAAFAKDAAENASRFAWQGFTDPMKREFFKITDIGTAAMKDPEKLERLNTVISELTTIYSTGKGCITPDECLPLEPDLTVILASSRDYNRLANAWKGWRDATGKKMKTLYAEYVSLHNEAVRDSGYADTGEFWRSWYETPTFQEDIERLYQQLKPLYQQIHAYVLNKLKQIYKDHTFPVTGHIPAHLLGNMWAQQWNSLYDDLVPFKDKPSVDITDELVKQGYDAVQMFNVSDQFFQSLGMIAMPPTFYEKSMLEKPADGREVVCHASAWDFYDGDDFRVKQCTEPTHSQMVTVHHEMGHVEYFLQYMNQSVMFRGGANPGFHEGIADVASLSFQTPKHLHDIGLLPTLVEDEEADINFLFNTALQKIAFLPFGYLIDQWRWEVFNGNTKPENYNTKWWDLRYYSVDPALQSRAPFHEAFVVLRCSCRYQGVSPPVRRTEEDFDPGAKFHIPSNVPYIRYFVSFVIQFQFHKVLCAVANQTEALHKCDIYRSTEAGNLFSEMLKLGSSKPWPEAMRKITGQDKMDAGPLMEYFQPLTTWLEEQNEGIKVEWDNACPEFPDPQSAGAHVVPSVIILLFLLFVSVLNTRLR